MIVATIYVDARPIDDHGTMQREGSTLVNFDHVFSIEFNPDRHCLDIWMSNGSRNSFHVSEAADEKLVMTRLFHAMAPLFEGRLHQVPAVRCTLDLRGV